jgi:hypothetical protein
MNPRERRLLIILGLVLGLGGASFLGFRWFYKPLQDYNAQIRRLQGEIARKTDELDETLQERKLLERARLMSLSPNIETAKGEYGGILNDIVRNSGLEIDDFRATENLDFKAFAPQQQEKVKAAHQFVNYTVRAKGDMAQLVAALEEFKKTPLIHRIRSLDIARQDVAKSTTDRLVISMRTEAMIVSGAEPHVAGPLAPDHRLVAMESLLALQSGPTSLGLLPWLVGPTGPFAQQMLAMESGYRRYNDMARKSIFRGGIPPQKEAGDEEMVDPDVDFDVLDYVRLDTSDPDNGEAFLRNLVFKVRPIRLRQSKWSGFNTFSIYSGELRSHVLMTGKVLRIEQRDVYFQVLGDIYCIHMGQTLHDAMWRSVTYEVRDRLKLRTDDIWAEQQRKEHAQQQVAQKKKKGSR